MSHIWHEPHAGLQATTSSGSHCPFWHEVPVAQWSTHTGEAPEVSHAWQSPHAGEHVGVGGDATHSPLWHVVLAPQRSTHIGVLPDVSHSWQGPQDGLHVGELEVGFVDSPSSPPQAASSVATAIIHHPT